MSKNQTKGGEGMEANLEMICQELKFIRQELHAISHNMEPRTVNNVTIRSDGEEMQKDNSYREESDE